MTFTRYLRAKKNLDDRSLNSEVWNEFFTHLKTISKPIKILELGGGIGTMMTRIVEKLEQLNQSTTLHYFLLDQSAECIKSAGCYLLEWATEKGFEVEQSTSLLTLKKSNSISIDISVHLIESDLESFLTTPNKNENWDLIIAHAFLDLIDLEKFIPLIFSNMVAGGYFYFTLNYNGHTRFNPVAHPLLEEKILKAYDQSMDQSNFSYPRSKTGRELPRVILDYQGKILKYGVSDWQVTPTSSGYQGDEKYFLIHLLSFFESLKEEESCLKDNQIKIEELEAWLENLKQMIHDEKISFSCHQVDYFGQCP